jgi:hypothetical protein
MNTKKIKCEICDKQLVVSTFIYNDKYFCCKDCLNKYKRKNQSIYKQFGS